MFLFYRCKRCGEEITNLDLVFHHITNSFDRNHPRLCCGCENELMHGIQLFIDAAIEK
ncbi:MAG: hypothetical protein U9M95_01495 [Candidatus Altiarchaeota archaeon]|nr:hypothetical protein [Candidatus Altiarchaeota archaeon]